jgi:hypothetical protein
VVAEHAAGPGGPRHPLVADALAHGTGHRHGLPTARTERGLGWPGRPSPGGGRQGWPREPAGEAQVGGEDGAEAGEEPAPAAWAA